MKMKSQGSPVQGKLSVDRLTEGLVLTNQNKWQSQPFRHFLAKMPPKQLFAIAGRLSPTLLQGGG